MDTRSVIKLLMLLSLFFTSSCGDNRQNSLVCKEVTGLRPNVESLSKDARLAQWVELAEQLRSGSLNALFLVRGQGSGRSIIRYGDRAYHGTLDDPIKWEEAVTAEQSKVLTKEFQTYQKKLRDNGLVGFELNGDSVVCLHIELKVVLVVLSQKGSSQAREMYERYAQKGQDPRGDIVIKVSPNIFAKSYRR